MNPPMQDGLAVSLIVCSRNRPDMLVDTVNSILAGRTVPTELVIMDQSDVENEKLARLRTDRGCDIRYTWTRTVGLSRANNGGIATARHDLLVFTHDDVEVTDTWLEVITASVINAGPRAVVTGQVVPAAVADEGGFVPSTKVDATPAVYRTRICSGVLYPMNMGMYRQVFDEVGVFDERLGPGTPFPAAEDNDLCDRLLQAGFEIHYVPDAILHHRAWRSERDYLALRWAYGRGQGAFYGKILGLRDGHALRCLRTEFAHRSRRLLGDLRRRRRNASGEAVYLLGLVAGMMQWLLTTRPRGRFRSPPSTQRPGAAHQDGTTQE
jgi:GT2 family glycosyltransferase